MIESCTLILQYARQPHVSRGFSWAVVCLQAGSLARCLPESHAPLRIFIQRHNILHPARRALRRTPHRKAYLGVNVCKIPYTNFPEFSFSELR